MRYYPVRIGLLSGEKDRLHDKLLMLGISVESFVQTEYRTAASYLVKPMTHYFSRAFRAD